MDTQYGQDALANRALYDAIVEHRRTYYAQKHINYDLLVPSLINFMIPEQFIEVWQSDYVNMRNYFIYGPSLEFDALMRRINELQVLLNGL